MKPEVPMNLSEFSKLVEDLLSSAQQAGLLISPKVIDAEFHSAPHMQPTCLPPEKQALYWFSVENRCLKVGKAGPNSNARYTSQHYNPRSSQSNLAKSILKHPNIIKEVLPINQQCEIDMLNEESVGRWIKENTNRCNFLIDISLNPIALSFLETFLQVRFNPLFEGKVKGPNVMR